MRIKVAASGVRLASVIGDACRGVQAWQPTACLFAKAEALLQDEDIDEEGMNPCGTE